MLSKLNAYWACLPHPAQAVIVAFTAAFCASVGKAFADPAHFCLAWVCLKQILGVAIATGLASAKAFYMTPNRTPKPA